MARLGRPDGPAVKVLSLGENLWLQSVSSEQVVKPVLRTSDLLVTPCENCPHLIAELSAAFQYTYLIYPLNALSIEKRHFAASTKSVGCELPGIELIRVSPIGSY